MKFALSPRPRRIAALSLVAAASLLCLGVPSSQANGYGHYILGKRYLRGDSLLTAVPVDFVHDDLVPGDSMTFRNKDPMGHSVTADALDAEGLPIFDTGVIGPGLEATIGFELPQGTYAYHCVVHPDMHGQFRITR
jgi:hypothetical protein